MWYDFFMNKATVLNCRVDLCDEKQALNCAYDAIRENQSFHIITINPEMIMNSQKNSDFSNIINNSNLNIPDGVGVKIALKLRKIAQQQIRGVDFARNLIELASKNNYRLALLGAKEEIIQKTKENILKKYPNINLVYVQNGYFDDENKVIEDIKNSKAQILLAGLGSPKQEELIYKLKNDNFACVMVGVGGCFDVFSGVTKEAPKIYQNLGLEWLYRTLSEPKRLKRIFPTLPIFLIKCIIECGTKKDF